MTNKIQVYGWHPITKEPLMGDFFADESPLEAGVYHMPQYTTKKAVPALNTRQCALYDEDVDDWRVVADYRGMTMYNTVDGSPVVIDSLGDIPENLTSEARPSAAHDWVAKKRVWLENKTKASELKKAEMEQVIAGKIDAMRQGVQNWLDSEAQKAGFDNIEKAVLRAGYDGPLRKIGTAYAVWMDTVWLECKTLLTRWQKGEVDLETFDDVRAYLTAPPSLK